MALTPQNSDAFLREVDDNLRQDRMVGAARRWGPIAGGVVLLLLALLAAVLFWRNHQVAQAGIAGETLSPALAALDAGRPITDQAALTRLAQDRVPAYQAAARFALAANVQAKGDPVAAAATLNAIATDSAIPQPERDLALIRAVSLQFDSLPPAQVIDRLKGLAISGTPWFPSAGELTALAWLKLGRKDKAGPLFGAIARDPNVPVSMRGRVAGMATNLGQTVAPAAGPAS